MKQLKSLITTVFAEKEEIYTGSGILVLSPTHHIKEAKILEQGPDGKVSSLIFSPKGINDTFTKFPDTFEYQALNDLKDGYRYMSLDIKIFETFINHFEVIDEISEKFATNRTTLNALFKKEYGTSAMDYLNNVRIQNASFMLTNTGLPIATVAERTGFSDEAYFSRAFKKATGKSPSEFRRSLPHPYGKKWADYCF